METPKLTPCGSEDIDCALLLGEQVEGDKPDNASDTALEQLARIRETAIVGDILSPIGDVWDALQ